MKALILAGGFGKRLYPLTENTPKSLLKIKGKAIIIDIIEKIHKTEAEEIVIVTNDCHFNKINLVLKGHAFEKPIRLINDLSDTEENSLGAVGDMAFAIDQAQLDTDLLIVAGDTLIEFPIMELAVFSEEKNASCVSVLAVEADKLRRMGVCECDSELRILSMEEKPREPKGGFGAFAVYMLCKEDLPLIQCFLSESGERESPGHFFVWLCKQKPIFGYKINGSCTDIGTMEDYLRAR